MHIMKKSHAAVKLNQRHHPLRITIDPKASVVLILDFYWQVPVSQWKPGTPRGQDREHHSGNTACLGGEYTHTRSVGHSTLIIESNVID